ncbi:MAG TPA: gliding motility-associated C-terminal domain-containing protein [Bacteroidia bacterium]|nr:gliding motility-associated C-terminal domain-containing protein [Bacteroidia bacterium]
MKKIALVLILTFIAVYSFAQRGKNGNLTVSSTVVVNEYTTLTADIIAGSTSITVANSGLNAKGRFAGALGAGDLVMIIQMQGDSIIGKPNLPWNPNTSIPNDSTWGQITKYNNCGNYEFAEVSSVPDGTTIQFDCGLVNNYTAAGRVQIIRVPRYNNLTIGNGDTITCDAWDSATGGIVGIEVLGNTVINTGGCINVTGKGFRGARLDSNGAIYGVGNTASNGKLYSYGKGKGEGIAGYEWIYDQFGGRNCKGSPANGGGGSNAHNGGGGGGANGGIVTNWVDGIGNPDVSTANDIAAWKLEYSWLPSISNRSGGGRGGYTFSANKQDPTKDGPNNSAWAGDNRDANGGWGGRPLDYSTGKIFIGGGGGAGDQDDGFGGVGGNGGGMVYLVNYGTVSGGGQISANGANGANATGTPKSSTTYAGQDGAGGAGAGGTVLINSIGSISGITINANGGIGGSEVFVKGALFVGNINEAEGPGGGGGGGYIATSSAGATESVAAGANGTTSSASMTKFPADGATKGGVGTISSISNFQIVAKNDTICSGQTATLSASLTGTVPGGTTINWYATSAGGASIATGATYTTGVLTKDTAIYVSTCPGTYRQAVNVIISGGSSVSINSPATICAGNSTNLSASGGTAYSWLPSASLSNAAIANPVASPTVTTTYTVHITTACGATKDSVVITVTPSPVVTISASSSTICSGGSTTLSENGGLGGTSYTWSSGGTTTSVTVNPISTTTYTLTTVTGTCTITPTTVITVNPTPTIIASATIPTICAGESTTLNGSGAITYTWTPNTALSATTGASVIASPVSTITYSVTGTTSACNSAQQTVVVTVNAKPSVTINPPSPGICSGGSVNLTANGAATYTWTPNTSLTATTGASVTASPATNTTYTVIGTSAAGCTDTTKVIVTVGSSLTAGINRSDTICLGDSTTLTAFGGSTYLWGNGSTNASITVSPTTPTTYSVTVTSGTCSATASALVSVAPGLTPKITGNTSICNGSNTTLTASGGSTYVWSGGSTATTSVITVSPASTTTYSVQVSNGMCKATTSAVVTINSIPVPTANASPQTICAGTTSSLSATGGLTYSWAPAGSVNPSTGANVTATPLTTTVYTVTVSNGSCSATDSVKVTVTPAPTGVACCNETVVNGQSIVLTITPAASGNTYVWTPASGLTCTSCADPSATPTVTTTYYVDITDSEGCSKRDSVIITVQENCGQIFIPKAFSPNGDHQNDVLYVHGDCIKSMDFIVFDRWGNKIFESNEPNDPSKGWDGKFNGLPMDAGTYVYYLTGQTIYNNSFTQKGNVTLVR